MNLKGEMEVIIQANPYTFGTSDYFSFIERKFARIGAIIDITVNTGDITITIGKDGVMEKVVISKLTKKLKS